MSKYTELSRVLMYIADIQLSVSDASKPTIAPRDLCEWIFEGIKDLPTIEVSEDCISKAYLEQEIENLCRSVDKDEDYWQGWNNGLDSIVRIIEGAPSVVPKQVTGKLADDVTARGTEDIGVKATEKSKLVPSRAEGEWELASDNDGEYGICSLCGSDADFTHYGKPYHYCPNCGAKMK